MVGTNKVIKEVANWFGFYSMGHNYNELFCILATIIMYGTCQCNSNIIHYGSLYAGYYSNTPIEHTLQPAENFYP